MLRSKWPSGGRYGDITEPLPQEIIARTPEAVEKARDELPAGFYERAADQVLGAVFVRKVSDSHPNLSENCRFPEGIPAAAASGAPAHGDFHLHRITRNSLAEANLRGTAMVRSAPATAERRRLPLAACRLPLSRRLKASFWLLSDRPPSAAKILANAYKHGRRPQTPKDRDAETAAISRDEADFLLVARTAVSMTGRRPNCAVIQVENVRKVPGTRGEGEECGQQSRSRQRNRQRCSRLTRRPRTKPPPP